MAPSTPATSSGTNANIRLDRQRERPRPQPAFELPTGAAAGLGGPQRQARRARPGRLHEDDDSGRHGHEDHGRQHGDDDGDIDERRSPSGPEGQPRNRGRALGERVGIAAVAGAGDPVVERMMMRRRCVMVMAPTLAAGICSVNDPRNHDRFVRQPSRRGGLDLLLPVSIARVLPEAGACGARPSRCRRPPRPSPRGRLVATIRV